ncbi:hypothetical protein IPJ91_00560 [bacterium]|nr:MAG: hypothetical protein IPJ91_00560 [bacterium]
MTCNKYCEYGSKPRPNTPIWRECCTEQDAAIPGRCSAPGEIVTKMIYCNQIQCVDALISYCPIGERPGGQVCAMVCPPGQMVDPTGTTCIPITSTSSRTSYSRTSTTTRTRTSTTTRTTTSLPTGCGSDCIACTIVDVPGHWIRIDPNSNAICNAQIHPATDCQWIGPTYRCPPNSYQGRCAPLQYCEPDYSCVLGNTCFGQNPTTDRICIPDAGTGFVPGNEIRTCDTCGLVGVDGILQSHVDDECMIGVNSGVACEIRRAGSNTGYSGNSDAYASVPMCRNEAMGPNNPAEFEVICRSGREDLDNARWNIQSLTSTLGHPTAPGFPGGSATEIRFSVFVTYPNDAIDRSEDTITITVGDGGSAFVSECGVGPGGTACSNNMDYQGEHTATVSIKQLVDTIRPALSRTSDFKITNTRCFTNPDPVSCDPNTILGSGQVKYDYKAVDTSGIVQHTGFAGPINFDTTIPLNYQFLAEYNFGGFGFAGGLPGVGANRNLITSFNYYSYSAGSGIDLNNPLLGSDVIIRPGYFSGDNDSRYHFKYIYSGGSVSNPVFYRDNNLSVVYTLRPPDQPMRSPISFRWGNGESGVLDFYAESWSAVDMFCNWRGGDNSVSTLSVGNPWMNTIGGNLFLKGAFNQFENHPYELPSINFSIPKSIAERYGGSQNTDLTTYIARSENIDLGQNVSKNDMTFASNGESLLDVYKFTKGRYESLYDYFKNLFGTVNRYDKRSEIYCGNDSNKSLYLKTNPNYNNVWIFNQSIEDYLLHGTDGNGHQTWLDNESNTLLRDSDCIGNAKAIVVEVNGNLQMRNHNDERNSPIYASTKPIIFLVDGNLTIDENIEKRNGNTIMFVVKGDVIIYGGKSRSMFDSKTVTQEPSSDTIDATFFVDGKFITMPDDGESHNINGVDYNGQTQFVADYPDMYPNVADGETVIWDSLKIKGSVIVSGLCPNQRSAPIYNADGTLRQSGIQCKSHFGRDLILVQNFLYPAESIIYDPAYLFDFKNLLKGVPPFNIRETGYDPFL